MPDYQHLYYALFNKISDFINELQKRPCQQETVIVCLRKIQSEMEEIFLNSDANVTETDSLRNQYDILHTGIMSLLIDYGNTCDSKFILSELKKIIHEADALENYDNEKFKL